MDDEDKQKLIAQQQQVAMQKARAVQMEDDNADLKRWELENDDVLTGLRDLLLGIPYLDKDKQIKTDSEGRILYYKLPIVNRDGAYDILEFARENTSKMVSMGFYDAQRLNAMFYDCMKAFMIAIVQNYEAWELDFQNVHILYGIMSTIIESSYTRALNGNEKIYRSKTQTSHEHIVKSEDPQKKQDNVGIIRRVMRKVI